MLQFAQEVREQGRFDACKTEAAMLQDEQITGKKNTEILEGKNSSSTVARRGGGGGGDIVSQGLEFRKGILRIWLV